MTNRTPPDMSAMTDEQVGDFWERHEPEEFAGWQEAEVKFARAPKRPLQLRLDPRDLWLVDRESKRTGITRAQLVRSWVREKLASLPGAT